MRAPVRRRILTVVERNSLKAQLGAGPLGLDPADVGVGEVWYQNPQDHTLNPVEVATKKARIKAILDAGSPQDESGAYKRKRDTRIKALEEDLRKDAIPHNHYHLKRQDSTDYNRVVKTLTSQLTDPVRRAKEDELKNLLRERESEDPDAGKLTFLRENRRIQG